MKPGRTSSLLNAGKGDSGQATLSPSHSLSLSWPLPSLGVLRCFASFLPRRTFPFTHGLADHHCRHLYSFLQEHHLQAAISAAAIRAAASSRPSGAGSPGPRASSSSSSTKPAPVVSESLYHIPTPDATGVVSNYSALYIPSRWHDPSSYVRFSDTIEETSAGPTGLGYSYTLDERDDEWLQANNRVARGEGTSASGAAGSTSPSDAGRGLRAKGKDREREKEDLLAPAMSEDDFELVMALMERWTDEKVPTLHTVSAMGVSSFSRAVH